MHSCIQQFFLATMSKEDSRRSQCLRCSRTVDVTLAGQKVLPLCPFCQASQPTSPREYDGRAAATVGDGSQAVHSESASGREQQERYSIESQGPHVMNSQPRMEPEKQRIQREQQQLVDQQRLLGMTGQQPNIGQEQQTRVYQSSGEPQVSQEHQQRFPQEMERPQGMTLQQDMMGQQWIVPSQHQQPQMTKEEHLRLQQQLWEWQQGIGQQPMMNQQWLIQNQQPQMTEWIHQQQQWLQWQWRMKQQMIQHQQPQLTEEQHLRLQQQEQWRFGQEMMGQYQQSQVTNEQQRRLAQQQANQQWMFAQQQMFGPQQLVGQQQMIQQPHMMEEQQLKFQQQNEEQQRNEPQYEQVKKPDSSTSICTTCGAQFLPHARICANCGTPRPRRQPKGPPCFHCKELLMTSSATLCNSCGKKQPTSPTKPIKQESHVPMHTGHASNDKPSNEHSTAMMVVSPPSLPPISNSPMVFGPSAFSSHHSTIQPSSTRQKQSVNDQPHPETKQLNEPSNAANTGTSGHLPPNREDSDNKAGEITNSKGVPASARPTKGHCPSTESNPLQSTHPLSSDSSSETNKDRNSPQHTIPNTTGTSDGQEENNVSKQDNQAKKIIMDDNNNDSSPTSRVSKPSSQSELSDQTTPAITSGTASKLPGGSTPVPGTSNETHVRQSYASAASSNQAIEREGEFHQKASQPGELFPGIKNKTKIDAKLSEKPPPKPKPSIIGLEHQDPKTSMKITFHAIVPMACWEWDEKSHIHIRFGHKQLGNWEVDCGQFQISRNIDSLHYEMTCTFDKFNANLLNSLASIPYKYVVHSTKVVDKDDCFEYLHAHHRHGDVNRCLLLHKNKLHQGGEYHKYDTIVYPKKTHVSLSFGEKLTDYATRFAGWITRKKPSNEAKDVEEFTPMDLVQMHVFCLNGYLGKYEEMVCQGKFLPETDIFEITDHVSHIYSSLYSFCLHTQGQYGRTIPQEFPDQNKFKEALKNWLVSLVTTIKDQPLQNPESQLLSAFFIIVCTAKVYKQYAHSSNSAILPLAKMITLHPELDTKSCRSYEFIKRHLLEKIRSSSEVLNFIIFISSRVGVTKEISPIDWMQTLPLGHFLKKQSEPFGKLDINIVWKTDLHPGFTCVKHKVDKLENFVVNCYDEMERYFALDPLLQLVFIRLAPESEFPALCERMPTYLTAAWLTHGVIGLKELHSKVEKLTIGIQCVKDSVMDENDYKELLSVKESAYQLFCTILEFKPNDMILSLITESITYVLHVVARLDKITSKDSEWQWEGRSNVFSDMKGVLHSWCENKEVLGVSMLGGSGTRFAGRDLKDRGKKELQVWNRFLTTEAPPAVAEDWHNTIRQLIDKRIHAVNIPKLQIELVCLMEEIDGIHPILADIVMEAGYHAIDFIFTQPQESGNHEFERLANVTHASERVGKLLGRILEKQYPNAGAIESISFRELLEWHMWPIFITVFVSKLVLVKGIPEDYHTAGICAQSCLEGMCEKLSMSEITIEELKHIRKYRDQMKRLCSAVTGVGVGERNNLYRSVEMSVSKRLEEWEAVRKRVECLHYLCQHLHSMDNKIQGFAELEAELSKDYNKKSINTLCVRNQNDDIQLICFLSAGSLLKFAGEFSVVNGQKYSNDIILKIWKKKLQEAFTDKPDLSIDDIYQDVWQPCLTQCKQLLKSLMELSMKLSDVDDFLGPHQTHLETHLQLLFKGINEVSKLNPNSLPELEIAVRRVRDYWYLRRYQKGADIFLRLSTSLGLTKGDFRQVQRLSQQLSTSMHDQTLNDVDESLMETGKFLEDVTRDQRKVHCLEMFAQCQDIVMWLQEITKDVNEITSFVNVALATAAGGEGDLSHDKLSNLRTVGSGFASLIYDFPKDAGFFELKNACTSVWEALDKNQSLPSLLDDCNKDIGWYVSVKDTQGSVEVTSYGQMRNILNYGRYLIGTSAQSTAVHTIHNLISLKLINTDKPLNKTSYNLEDLRDLESKLVLITGTNAKNRMEVDHYLNILHHVTRIAEVLLALQQAGNIAYSGWMMSFNCATYTVSIQGEKQELQLQEDAAAFRVAELRACAKNMENALREWENEVEESRSRHYELNYYTTLQLLRLRKELGFVRQNPTKQVDPEILALLESISPEISSDSVTSMMASLEKHLLDLRAAADYVPYEEPSIQASASIPVVTIQANSPALATVGTEAQVLPEIGPTPAQSMISLISSRKPNNNPIITEDDLKEDQKAIFSDLVECYSRLLLLKAFEDCPATANQYDIQDWCDENDGFLHFDVEEEQDQHNMDVVSSEESSTNSGSDDEDKEKMNVFSQSTQKSQSEFKPSHLKNKYPNVEVKVVHKPLINESHPVVQQLVEEEYDLDASIEAVQLFGTLEKAMDYLATKDADSGDEESVTPTMASTELTTDESGNIIVYDDPKAEEKYLSLDELGIVLGTLSEQLPGAVREKRTFNEDLKPGSPNVIVAPSGDILRTVLALYMEDENLPLPTLDEVLICNSTTTAEQVNLLWLRAIGDPSYRRIFCLVHAEKLSYQICDRVVETLNELRQGISDYRLVILCSKEGQDKSHMVSKLLLHKKSILLKHKDVQYQTYLRNRFTSETTPQRASVVDHENSCVRVVSSKRSGMGKSLFIKRMTEQLKTLSDSNTSNCEVVVPIHGPIVTSDVVITFLKDHYKNCKCMIYHFDIAPSIVSEVDTILFSLLILRGLTDSQGCVWRCHPCQLYAIEVTISEKNISELGKIDPDGRTIDLLCLLPTVKCLSPQEVVETSSLDTCQVGMDQTDFKWSTFQRVYQYLRRQDKNQKLDRFKFQKSVEGNMTDCLQKFLKYCGVEDPSWCEIRHFAKFLDLQLECCENSVFCDETFVGDIMTGLKGFVIKFMIRMSRDFATPSLKGELMRGIEDQPELDRDNLQEYAIEHRRKWEESSHPYIFFNDDTMSITFVGFIISKSGDLIDPSRTVLEERIMSQQLYAGLKHQGVNFSDDYRKWEKSTMIQKLSMVMGLGSVDDPDKTYVLTVDNLIKMLAIQMRFRCGIPVVIMGETGCGKTRLIRYMCDLARNGRDGKNMLILKVHGGTGEKDIINFIAEAEKASVKNKEKQMDTVVFFDEANTTDAIGLIKEIMCDRRIHGKPISQDLKFIAACNPYRRHSDEMIERLEKAGLGFYVRASQTQQRLGHIPLRELVYRVLDLPPSMRPLVYDFGQLKKDTEDDYIIQIVGDHIKKHPRLSQEDTAIIPAIASVLAASQAYMRKREDECSFVSLRDVERAMIVFKYFYEKVTDFKQADKPQQIQPIVNIVEHQHPSDMTCALILAVSVCYHSRLQDREKYEVEVSSKFVPPLDLPGKEVQFTNQIAWYQNVLLDNMELGPNIAKNAALRENVFMMAICIELRIPLFLVGKPGSSKSLAKSIIQDSMHGKTSRSDLLKKFKQVQMFSYQCSQLATSESVIDVFDSAKKFQAKQDTTQYVSVVVLDEVGLAEDSPNLPLKALHPLLEDGTEGAGAKGKDEVIEREKRVAFVGISNWALDPAKMNRGVMVTRGKPDIRELEFSAQGICGKEEGDQIKNKLDHYFKPLAQAYEAICKKQKREFFGLRDFYSLIKMLYWMCKKSGGRPLSWPQMKHAVMRNFGGLKSEELDPFLEFSRRLNMGDKELNPDDYENVEGIWSVINPDCTELGLIKTSLDTRDTSFHGENRYLLFLTENYAALDILEHYIRGKKHVKPDLPVDVSTESTISSKPFTLFGSSFPKDKEYTQVCRNINQIKICMETGRTVILLNLENLYESLYDVLNQYYMHYGDNRYVDLGLQTHRVKCRVHKDFKLILIAERDTVYVKFPTPLINRLEKHFVLTSSVLKDWQQEVLFEFKNWIRAFSVIRDFGGRGNFKESHAFIGYQKDTPAAVVFQASKQLKHFKKENHQMLDYLQEMGVLREIPSRDLIAEPKGSDVWKEAVLRLSQFLLLQTASDDSLIRLKRTDVADQQEMLMNLYYSVQQHSSVIDFVQHHIHSDTNSTKGLLLQVTTHGHILLKEEMVELESMFIVENFLLQEFDTELDFSNKVGPLFHRDEGDNHNCLLVIQCDSGHINGDLIACARYRIYDERVNALEKNKLQGRGGVTHVLFIINLPHYVSGSSFVGFQGDPWISAHIDDPRPSHGDTIEPVHAMSAKISELFIGGYINDIQSLLSTTCEQVQLQNESNSDNSSDEIETEDSPMRPSQDLYREDELGKDSDSEVLFVRHETEGNENEPEIPHGHSPDAIQGSQELYMSSEFNGQDSSQLDPLAHNKQDFVEQHDDENPTAKPASEEMLVVDIEDIDTELVSVSSPQERRVLQNIDTTFVASQENLAHAVSGLIEDNDPSTNIIHPVARDVYPAVHDANEGEQAQDNLSKSQYMLEQVCAEHPIGIHYGNHQIPQFQKAQCRRLYNCIQAAASKVEDLTKDRSTQRVTRLTKLIQRLPDRLDPNSFHGILVMHIYRLLREREAERTDLSDWVLTEALNSSNLEVGGTFRNVLARKIDDVVIPIFAKIIASIDRNYNLDLINPKDGETPLSQFWLAMFRDPNIQKLRYSDMVMGDKVPGLGGRKLDQDFRCSMPFFWLIKDAVESQWDNAKSHAGVSVQTHHQQLCEFIHGTPVGAVLKSVDSKNWEAFYECYLTDYVKSVHRCKHKLKEHNIIEFQLVSDALNHIVHCSTFRHESFTSMIAALHLAYETNKSKILWFGQIVAHSPGTMKSLVGMFPSKELPDMELHLYAAEKTIDKLEPPLKKDNPNQNLAQWLNHVRLSRNTIDSILSMKSENERFIKARSSWCRICATQVFVELVMLKHPQVNLKILASRLSKRWKGTCDFLQLSTVNALQLQLSSVPKLLKDCDDKAALKEVKRSCRGFFMEVVSEFCFKGDKAPEPDLVKMLLDTVFMEKDEVTTQELTPYKDEKTDKIPTIRSFLLQLLLEHSMDQVREHLKDYLNRSHRVLMRHQAKTSDHNLYLLIIQCFEDALSKKMLYQHTPAKVRVEEVTKCLIQGFYALQEHRRGTPTLEYLEGVAKIRCSLSVVAEVLKNDDSGHHIMELLRAAERMCSDSDINCIDSTGHRDTVGPVIYLLKLLVRQYGMPCLKAAAEVHEWIIPAELRSDKDKSVDQYVIYGDLYKRLRGAINGAMYGDQMEILVETTQNLNPCEVAYFLLALFSKATLSRSANNTASRINDDALERLNEFIMKYQLLSNELRLTSRTLLANQQGGRVLAQMIVSPEQPLHCRTLMGVVVHAATVFFTRQNVDVLSPFVNMLNNPAILNQSYLPTMQEDPLIESQGALLQMIDKTGKFYECPNGHKYFVGNCGQTYSTGVCNVCKAPIGGNRGQPVGGNKLTNTQDTTKKGYDLGAPETRTISAPERNLSARAVCIVRALMHSAFVWASCNNDTAVEAIASLVTPQVPSQHLPEFFWAHLEKDIELLGRDTGRGLDEAVMIVHIVLRQILTTDPPVCGSIQTVSSLGDKEARKEWERIFNEHYVHPVLSTLDDSLAIAMDRVVNDERQDHDQLFYLVYEKVKYDEESLEPHLWTYRSRITLEHLRQTLQEKKMRDKHPILHEFLQAETELRATQYLPDIARLQRCLYDRFNRQVDRKDVKRQTIEAFIKQLPNDTIKSEYRGMIDSVKAAWSLVGHKLKNHGRLPVEEKYYIAYIDDNTPMEYLVPTTSEAGVCTTALVDFLTLTHNNFIERCRGLVEKNNKSTLNFWREHKVPITHLHRCHLLDYEHQLPSIILSHCQYSLKVGKGQDVKYNHQALEKHILNRFIHGKPLILIDIPQVVYRKDIYTTDTFADIRKKVEPQELLQQRVKQDIIAELRTPDRLREALDVVEIVLGFLSSGGGKADKPLGEYIDKTLKMKKRRFSQKAKNSCQLKHTLSLWETIAVELARQLCLRGQEPFDSIRQEYLRDLSKEEDDVDQFIALDRCLGQFDPDLLLGTLYEFIETYVKRRPLQECDQPLVAVLELVLDRYGTELPHLSEFPASIKLDQAVAAWKHIVHYYANKN